MAARRRTQLAGDEIYVDAHILKWKPIANLLGLHTAYELDRIAGRYHSLKDEQVSPRTVHSLGTDKPIDLFNLRRRYVFLAPLLDADYGSASFVPVTQPAEFDVMISTTGVLIRERKPVIRDAWPESDPDFRRSEFPIKHPPSPAEVHPRERNGGDIGTRRERRAEGFRDAREARLRLILRIHAGAAHRAARLLGVAQQHQQRLALSG